MKPVTVLFVDHQMLSFSHNCLRHEVAPPYRGLVSDESCLYKSQFIVEISQVVLHSQIHFHGTG